MIKTRSYFLGIKDQAGERAYTLIIKFAASTCTQGGLLSRSEESRQSWSRTPEGGLALSFGFLVCTVRMLVTPTSSGRCED